MTHPLGFCHAVRRGIPPTKNTKGADTQGKLGAAVPTAPGIGRPLCRAPRHFGPSPAQGPAFSPRPAYGKAVDVPKGKGQVAARVPHAATGRPDRQIPLPASRTLPLPVIPADRLRTTPSWKTDAVKVRGAKTTRPDHPRESLKDRQRDRRIPPVLAGTLRMAAREDDSY